MNLRGFIFCLLSLQSVFVVSSASQKHIRQYQRIIDSKIDKKNQNIQANIPANSLVTTNISIAIVKLNIRKNQMKKLEQPIDVYVTTGCSDRDLIYDLFK